MLLRIFCRLLCVAQILAFTNGMQLQKLLLLYHLLQVCEEPLHRLHLQLIGHVLYIFTMHKLHKLSHNLHFCKVYPLNYSTGK